MCVSAAPAEFTGAIAFGCEVNEKNHLLGYQNKAQSYVGPNCMLLHVPTDELTPDSLIPTESAPAFMEAIGNAVPSLWPTRRGGGALRGGGAETRGAVVVEYGAYDVVLASSARNIPAALDQVNPAKRPSVSDELLAWYDRNFPEYSFLLACFNNAYEMAADPILVSYEPQDPSTVFVPGLESHNGLPPALGSRGHVRDFKVAFGSLLADGSDSYSGRVPYDDLGDLEPLLPTHIVGFRDVMVGVNADYAARVEDVRAGVTGEKLFVTQSAHFKGSMFDMSRR